jgi:hypothetical protein
MSLPQNKRETFLRRRVAVEWNRFLSKNITPEQIIRGDMVNPDVMFETLWPNPNVRLCRIVKTVFFVSDGLITDSTFGMTLIVFNRSLIFLDFKALNKLFNTPIQRIVDRLFVWLIAPKAYPLFLNHF